MLYSIYIGISPSPKSASSTFLDGLYNPNNIAQPCSTVYIVGAESVCSPGLKHPQEKTDSALQPPATGVQQGPGAGRRSAVQWLTGGTWGRVERNQWRAGGGALWEGAESSE